MAPCESSRSHRLRGTKRPVQSIGCWRAGLRAETVSPSDIVDALHQVDQDLVVPSPAMAPRFMAYSIQPSEKGAGVTEIDTQLTAREQDVLKLVASGMSNAEIGGNINVSGNTVKTHVKKVLGKLHMKNRGEAVA